MSEKVEPLPNKITELVGPVAVTSQEMTYSNKVYLNPFGKIPSHKRYIIFKGYVLMVAFSETIPKGKIGLNKKFRQFLVVSLIDEVIITAYDPKSNDSPVSSMHLRIEMLLPPKQRFEIDDGELIKQFKKDYNGFYVAVDQIFVVNFQKVPMIIAVDRLFGDQNKVFLGPDTTIQTFASGQQQIRLKSTKNAKKNIFSANFTMDSLGIGGLDYQLTNLFRRAFASRRLPHTIIQKFGIKHIKGILLYGPPGTGKTLIARQLAKSLKAKSLQIVNGPQVFSKYVGESQQNIRKLFAPARDDQKKYGDESPIHIIVFDEIDAICRQRGSDSSGTNAKDAVVNQLLTNLDGVEALNNIIVIGMTNRKDLLDQAVLRPGRLQVHIQIGIPGEDGRLQILNIHTKKLSEEGLMNKNVKLAEIAHLAKNYTGAELEAVIKNAASYAMTKGNDLNNFSKQLQIKSGTTIQQKDLLKALQQVTPGFGIDQQNFQVYLRSPLIDYGPSFSSIIKVLTKLTNNALSGSRQISSVLLYGPNGSGKSSLAAHFAKSSRFTYIKIISPQRYIGVGTFGRINSLIKVFNDAYKSKQSLIILDNIERLIQYVQTGPDFNNTLMQALLTLVKRIPSNPDCRMMVLGTTSNYAGLDLLDVDEVFNIKLKVPLLTRADCTRLIGADLGIENVSIKRMTTFKEMIGDKPQAVWSSMWTKFNS